MKTVHKGTARLRGERGTVIIYVAISLAFFLAVAALSIDVGRHRLVRNELQNAADAAALSACNALYARTPLSYPMPPPAWAAALAEAGAAVRINEADRKALKDAVAVTGWWNVSQPSRPDQWATPPPSPPPGTAPTSNHGPGVRVSVAKSGSQNDGPIVNVFGPLLGVDATTVGVSATAVAASPGSLRPNAVIPVAIARALADDYERFNSPTELVAIGSPYKGAGELAGQWTTFLEGTSRTPTIRDLIETGNPTALNIGVDIWIVNGVHDNVYDGTQHPSINNTYSNKIVWLPVVDVTTMRANTGDWVKFIGVIPFHVQCAGKGCSAIYPGLKSNPKIIMGHFVGGPDYGGPLGPHYGPFDRCRLFR